MKENNEQSQKLKYLYDNYDNIKYYSLLIGIITFLMWEKNSLKKVLLWALLLVLVIGIYYLVTKQKIKDNNIIKDNGIKVIGTIKKVDYSKKEKRRGRAYYLIVEDDKLAYRIGKIKNNSAYRIIEEYLCLKQAWGHMQNMEEINIDLYICETKIFADLDSVDIPAIEKKCDFYRNKQKNEQ